MKGANHYRLRGRHVSIALLTLTLTTIFFCTWEKNPFVTTLLSAQEQFNFYSSDPFGPEDSSSTISLNEKEQEKPHFTISKTQAKDFGSTVETNTSDDGSEDSFSTLTLKQKGQEKSQSTSSKTPAKGFGATSGNFTTSYSHKKKDCNYAKGRWVADHKRPLYSGFRCKQWLSEMWACRLTQRTDFSYEGYRWQPDNCKMPEFEPSAFLKRMKDKTIAFIGDSLGRQQFQSLMCMATGGEWRLDVEDVGAEYGLVKARGAIRPDGWVYRFSNTNTTILYYWSASLADLEPLNTTNPATEVAMHLDRAPAFMRRYLDRFDVLVLNTGHHWNRGKIRGNHWVMYVDGKPLEDKKLLDIVNAKNFTIHNVVRWLDSQLDSHPQLKVFFRTISPRHFRNGDWNTGGNCDNTIPLTGGSDVSQDESSDPVIAAAVKGTRVKLLDITAISDLRDEGHISRYSIKATQGVNDCLHWCLPGIPDTWNELLLAQT